MFSFQLRNFYNIGSMSNQTHKDDINVARLRSGQMRKLGTFHAIKKFPLKIAMILLPVLPNV